jgi:hypothetical protein
LAAEQLSRLGFEVIRTGRRAVSVQAEPERFLRCFGVRAEPGRALVARLAGQRAGLADLIDSIEIVPEPLNLAR